MVVNVYTEILLRTFYLLVHCGLPRDCLKNEDVISDPMNLKNLDNFCKYFQCNKVWNIKYCILQLIFLLRLSGPIFNKWVF